MSERRLDQDFAAFEPLLWRILASLARHGFVAPPMDARDIIHDFYLDGWDGVKERFDAEIGSFTTYLASAFYKFARRRIVALHSWRHRQVDIDLLADLPSEDKIPPQVVEHNQQLAAIRAALAKLPREERAVLQDYLSDSEPSERVIATRHLLTRYALRERLLSAVGRVAVELGCMDPNIPESLVAFYLWHDGRSPKNVGSLLGISVSDVHSLKGRFAANLLASIRSINPPPSKRDTIMPTILQLFKTALQRVGDHSAISALRERRERVQESLDAEDDLGLDLSEAEMKELDEHPDWVAEVYSIVAAEPKEADADSAVQAAVADLRAQEEREIGEAFVFLLQLLPGEFHIWRNWFDHLSQVSEDEQAYLLADPSFVDVPNKASLASYGLTPLVFHEAVSGLELLFDRLLLQGLDSRTPRSLNAPWPPLFLIHRDTHIEVPSNLVLAQFGTTPGLRAEAREPMANWVLQVLDYCPQLVRGYEAERKHDAVRVTQVADILHRDPPAMDIAQRWARTWVNASGGNNR
jgi:RNA polymerase sigma factor (sigma-70 family)